MKLLEDDVAGSTESCGLVGAVLGRACAIFYGEREAARVL